MYTHGRMRTDSIQDGPARTEPERQTFESVLSKISSGAADRDAHPSFPGEPFRHLAGAGVLAIPVPQPVEGRNRRATFAEEWRALRAVARADGSVGRILDGHLNGVERLAVLAPEPRRSAELRAVVSGGVLLGVWGANPIVGEGEPAHLAESGGRLVIRGVKTFCSGATGVQRALVAVRDRKGTPPGPPLLAYVDVTKGTTVDRGWFRGAGMRSSESHRVEFEDAPVLEILGEPGELVREPYFGRDAVRTAVTWAGIADAAAEATLEVLAAKASASGKEPDDLVSLAAGRITTARLAMDRWLDHAAGFADEHPEESMASFSVHLRGAVAEAGRQILAEAERAVGSHPFAVAGTLDRARRDLELFLLQHRLEPALARAGRREILARGDA